MPTAGEIVQRFYDAEAAYMAASEENRDFSGMQATLSPNIKLYQTPALPYGGDYEGHSGFLKWSTAMASYFDKVVVDKTNVLENGDDVVILMTVDARVRKTGEEISMPGVQTVKVDKEKGVIVEIRPFYWDAAMVTEALSK